MSKKLFVAWRSGGPDNGQWGPVGRLEHGSEGYRYVYTAGAKCMPGFMPFPGMLDLEAIYESEELFPLFANRLLAPKRPEYEAYLAWGGFDYKNPPDPIAILGVTEGRRATDSLELFPCPEPDQDGQYINKFFLHGVRWLGADGLEKIKALRSGDDLHLLPEPTNKFDGNAVQVLAAETPDGVKIGYVPRYMARDIKDLLAGCTPDAMALKVDRVNHDAPLQQRVLCVLRSCWPDSFQPCSGKEFAPIVGELSPMSP